MPDDLYDRDILAWSQHQAELLRRVARGERVNEVDWDHVVEEIEDVGLSELNAVRAYLRLTLVHLLKLRGWPASSACPHWRLEVANFQAEADQRFVPSMRQRLDLPDIYRRALKQIDGATIDGTTAAPLPPDCPFSLDDLLATHPADLETRLHAIDPSTPE